MPPPLPTEFAVASSVAVTFNDCTIIWGYTLEKTRYIGVLLCHKGGKWMQKKTCGSVPAPRLGASATLHKGTMYLMSGITMDKEFINDVYALDLNSWRWKKLNPRGTPPIGCTHLSTWLHKGKVYGFGGITDYHEAKCNQLFSYNVSENSWELPSVSGNIPSPRAGHTTFICGDTAFLFGGMMNDKGQEVALNDLYTLNMKSRIWTRVHTSPMATEGLPERVRGHSMTLISPQTAVLFGGGGQFPDSGPRKDCWLLNTAMVLGGEYTTPSELWQRCQHHENVLSARGEKRSFHSAVLEPVSKRLWILGGSREIFRTFSDSNVVSLSFNSGASLKLLAMESILRDFDPDHPMLEAREFPRHLKSELVSRYH